MVQARAKTVIEDFQLDTKYNISSSSQYYLGQFLREDAKDSNLSTVGSWEWRFLSEYGYTRQRFCSLMSPIFSVQTQGFSNQDEQLHS